MENTILLESVRKAVSDVLDEKIDAGRLGHRCCEYCEVTPQIHNEHHKWIGRVGRVIGVATGKVFLIIVIGAVTVIGLALKGYFFPALTVLKGGP